MKKSYTIDVLGKKIGYTISPEMIDGESLFRLKCEEVNLDQCFDAEDLANFLTSSDFAFFIIDELNLRQNVKNRRLQIRITENEQAQIEKEAIEKGFKSVSAYARNKVLA